MTRRRKINNKEPGRAADPYEHPSKGVELGMPRGGGLPLIRYLVRSGCYEIGQKVLAFIEDGMFTLDDVECSIRTGEIRKRERDELGQAVGNKKYVIVGPDTQGYAFYTAGKILRSSEGNLYYIITAHSEGADYDDIPVPRMRKRKS